MQMVELAPVGELSIQVGYSMAAVFVVEINVNLFIANAFSITSQGVHIESYFGFLVSFSFGSMAEVNLVEKRVVVREQKPEHYIFVFNRNTGVS